MTTPAGWYLDPDGTGGQRYWNGESWTEHRAPAAVEAPPGSAHATPARKSGRDPKVLIGLGAAVVVLIAVLVTAVVLTLNTRVGEDSVTHRPAEATASSTPDPEAATEVRDGNSSFVITGVTQVDAVADQEFPEIQKAAQGEAAQGEYVIVKMTVTNVGNEPQTFFASFNTLSDGSTVYQSDDEAWIYLGNT